MIIKSDSLKKKKRNRRNVSTFLWYIKKKFFTYYLQSGNPRKSENLKKKETLVNVSSSEFQKKELKKHTYPRPGSPESPKI